MKAKGSNKAEKKITHALLIELTTLCYLSIKYLIKIKMCKTGMFSFWKVRKVEERKIKNLP